MNVDEQKAAANSKYKGTIYHFCSEMCKEKFEKDPEKFVTQEKK
jgi:YHS domain-containing protein